MKNRLFVILLSGVLMLCSGLFTNSVFALETLVDAPVSKVSLFKNGVGMVTRTFEAGPEGGEYIVEDVPDPVHGTFWIQSASGAEARFVDRDVPCSPDALTRNELIHQLTGKEVDVFITDGERLTGTLMSVYDGSSRKYDTNYERSMAVSSRYGYRYSDVRPNVESEFIVLDTDSGTEFIDHGTVRRIRLHGSAGEFKPMERRHVMLFTVEPAKGRQVVSFSYLTKGLSWAPSYRLDIAGEIEMLSMKAVVKNELIDIDGAEFFLISGYPSIRFSHVKSPLSQSTDWNRFFSELAYDPQTRSRNNGAGVMTQAVMSNSVSSSSLETDPAVAMPDFLTEGYDIHYLDAGRHSVARGESIAIQVAGVPVETERIVDWLIPDERDRYGRYYSYYYNQNNKEEETMDDVWDSVRFANPFDFPMTTAPLSIYRNGMFYGQTITYWAAPGQEIAAKVTKALNIRVLHSEQEIDIKRDAEKRYGYTYQKGRVEGKVYVRNNRNESEHLIIRRRFSGNLISTQGEPEKTLLPAGVWHLNQHSQLLWDIELKPGEEKTIVYEYEVLSMQ
ncbi:MAG TPA: hypothetical protein PLN69_06435 [bacterium]|nr:hypothetical protein [bacterium]